MPPSSPWVVLTHLGREQDLIEILRAVDKDRTRSDGHMQENSGRTNSPEPF